MKKRILQIITTPFSCYGIASLVKNYVRQLSEIYHFDFLLCAGTNLEGECFIESIGGEIVQLGCNRNKQPIRYMIRLKEYLMSNKYDAVHVHGNSGTLFFDIHAAKLAKVPIRIAHAHSKSTTSKIVHKMLKPFLNRDKTIGIACSQDSLKWLFSEKNAIVLNNAIETEKYAYSVTCRERLRNQYKCENQFVILHVGHFTDVKNHKFLVNIFAKLLEVRPQSKLVLVGDGPLKDKIYCQVRNLQIEDKVEFLGAMENTNEIYSMADCFVFPSLYEGLGLVLIEAQASGLPCVASTGVPIDGNVTENVKYMSLMNENEWIDWLIKIVPMENEIRDKCSYENIDLIKLAKYDVKQNAYELARVYDGLTE